MADSTNSPFLVGMVEEDTAFVHLEPHFSQMEFKNFVIPTIAARASCNSLKDRCGVNSQGVFDCSSANYTGLPFVPENSTLASLPSRVLGLVGEYQDEIVGRM